MKDAKAESTVLCNEESILAVIVIDDGISKELMGTFVGAYFRAFILKNRQSGEVYAKFRFKYPDNKRSWSILTPKDQATAKQKLIEGITTMLMKATRHMLNKDIDVVVYEPPNPDNTEETIRWLEEKDVISVVGAKGTA